MLHLFVGSGSLDEKFGLAIDSKQENFYFPSLPTATQIVDPCTNIHSELDLMQDAEW